ncbi:MAG TPA: hypothetical protein VL326_11845 [Kofleriaceae bacterium]|nr:hypothetical protein [Kofleriaceae bacterium]
MTMLDERRIEGERSPAARAAVIARCLADDRHRTIAFFAAYLAMHPVENANVGPVIRQLVHHRARPDLAPCHLRRLAAIVHVACATAAKQEPSVASVRTAGITRELPVWRAVAARL